MSGSKVISIDAMGGDHGPHVTLAACRHFLDAHPEAHLLMVGLPEYDTYLAHMERTHPDQAPMTYEEFFRERQEARYGGKSGPKCC